MPVSALTPDELRSLVLKAQDGDTDAFGKIYDAFLTPIYRYVVFRFPQDLAEDLVIQVICHTGGEIMQIIMLVEVEDHLLQLLIFHIARVEEDIQEFLCYMFKEKVFYTK